MRTNNSRIYLIVIIGLLLTFTFSCDKEDPVELPKINTSSITEITINTAKSGGNITDDGGASVTSRGVVWSTSENPSVDNHIGKTTDGGSTGEFTSEMDNLQPATTYYVRAYATNFKGTAYGQQESFKTQETYALTLLVSPSGSGEVTGAGNYQEGEEVEINANANDGYVFVNWTNEDGVEISQDANFTYTMPADDILLTANFEEEVSGWPRDTQTQVVEVTNPATGKTWMDRNLGASRAATSSTDAEAYGDLYQWGRAADGHQNKTSGITSDLSSSDTPGHGNFILSTTSPNDWRSPQNENLWQGINGINNPCPDGYRLPTDAEWDAERLSWSSNDAAGAFASPLKLPVSGFRSSNNGSLLDVDTDGRYWSSTVTGPLSHYLYFSSTTARMYGYTRARGASVRCIKD